MEPTTDLPADFVTDAEKLDEIYAFVKRVGPVLDAIDQHLPAVLAHVENLGPMIDQISKHPMLKMLGVGR